jgi:parallel beta-helix repeat protein
VIEANTITGNANGIILVPGVEGNIVRHNTVLGNPPVQFSVTFPQADAVDIRNTATAGANTIEDNVCLTAINADCPTIGRRGEGEGEKEHREKRDDKDDKDRKK